MKKIYQIIICLFLVSCGNDTPENNCFQNIRLSEIINLSNPEFINLEVPGGYATTNLAGRNIIIIRRSNTQFKAYDLQCPENDCSNAMTFDGLKLKCPCSQKEYNSLNGSPIDGNGCFALEYTVQQSGNTLIISR